MPTYREIGPIPLDENTAVRLPHGVPKRFLWLEDPYALIGCRVQMQAQAALSATAFWITVSAEHRSFVLTVPAHTAVIETSHKQLLSEFARTLMRSEITAFACFGRRAQGTMVR